MNKILKKLLFALVVLLVPSLSFAQVGTSLTQTTLGSTIGLAAQTFALGSVSGISGFGAGITSPVAGGPAFGNITDLYIDRELMQVVSVNTTAKTVVVIRGAGGSQASAHASGTMVLAGPPGAFFDYDPAGYCGTLTAVQGVNIGNPPAFTPWVNQKSAAQWICSTITNTWVPGFSGYAGYNSATPAVTTAVASATTIVPTGPLFHITGTTPIVNITQPVGCNATAVGGCSFTAIFDAVGSWTAAGNISVASGTVVANTSVTFTWDAKNSKWVPSSNT